MPGKRTDWKCGVWLLYEIVENDLFLSNPHFWPSKVATANTSWEKHLFSANTHQAGIPPPPVTL